MSLKWLAVIGLVAFPVLARAECGWLLMAPPPIGIHGWARGDAPLSMWGQVGAFDSAEACERRRSKNIENLLEMKKIGDREGKYVYSTAIADFSRCLPASQVPVR